MNVLEYFPYNIREKLIKEININNYKLLEEIRIRVNRPIILKFNSEIRKIDYLIGTEDILRILEYITENLPLIIGVVVSMIVQEVLVAKVKK